MAVEALPTLEEITKQLEEANAKKKGASPETAESAVETDSGDPNPDPSAEPAETKAEEAAEVEEPEKKEETEEKKDPWSKRFAAMTRLEKQRRQKEAALTQKLQEFETRQRQLEEREAKLLKAKDPLDALKLHGYSYEDASYAILGQKNEKEEDPVESKVRSHLDPVSQKAAALEEKIKELDQKMAAVEAERQEQAAREIKFAIQATSQDGEYPYIQGLGKEAHDMVYDLMCEYFAKHKQSLTYKQACDRIEGYFKRIGSIGGAKSDTVTDTKAPAKVKPTSAAPAKTLTQAHTTSTRSKQDLDSLSDQEAKKKLATMLKFR